MTFRMVLARFRLRRSIARLQRESGITWEPPKKTVAEVEASIRAKVAAMTDEERQMILDDIRDRR